MTGSDRDLVLLVLGAALGAAFSAVPLMIKKSRALYGAILRARHKRLVSAGLIDRWLLTYYDRRTSIFSARIGDCERTVPVLSRPEWQYTAEQDPRSEQRVTIRPAALAPFPINRRALRRHRLMGGRLYDAWPESLYLDEVGEEDSRLKLFVRPCNYSQIASALLSLQHETARAARRSNQVLGRFFVRTPLRDRYLPDVPAVGVQRDVPFSIGSTTLLAVKDEVHGYSIAIQTRSPSVITAPNLKAVIPNFGLEANRLGGNQSKYSVVFFNFMKEYLEELFDYEELIGDISQHRLEPDWFEDLPEAETLLAALGRGRFSLEFLGLGIDCLSGTAVLGLLAVADDPTLVEELRTSLTVNWEVASSDSDVAPVEFVGIDDSRLAFWHQTGRYQSSSVFTIALGLAELHRRHNLTKRGQVDG